MRVLLTFTAAFVVAAIAALMPLPGIVSLLTSLILLLLGVVLLWRKRFKRVGLLALGGAMGLLWCTGYQAVRMTPVMQLYGETVQITGVASDYSVKTNWGIRVDASISAEDIHTSAVVWLPTQKALMPGDRFTVEAELSDVRKDGSFYYWSEGTYLLAYGQDEPEIRAAARIPLRYVPRYIANRLEQSLHRCVPEDVLGYAVALTTGDRSGLSSLEQANLKTTGIYHALALSGMHMTTLLGAISLLVRNRRRRAMLGIPTAILFTLITGARAPLVRACVMHCLMLLAPVCNREEDAPTSMGAAALLLTLQNPCAMLGWGTQLSFTSVAGILLLSGKLQTWMLGSKAAWKKRPKILRKLWTSVTASWAATFSATALSLPLMMLYFGMFSLIAPLTNLLTGWIITWNFRLSILTGILGIASPQLGSMFGFLAAWGIRYVSWLAGLLSNIPFAALYTDSFYVVIWIAACYGIGLLLLTTPKEQRRFLPSACCITLLLCLCIGLSLLEQQGFLFTVLDVGQGQCLIFRAHGQTAMIDCGGSGGEQAGDTAADYLDSLGEQRIELLILTHYDSDHVGGVPELLQRVQVDRVIMPDYQPDSDARQELLRAAEAVGTEITLTQMDLTAQVGDFVFSLYASREADTANDHSLAVRFSHHRMDILVTGDMDAAGERRLLRTHNIGDIDVLVAGHHGSKFSTSYALLKAVKPEIVVISVGKNSYGHPSDEALSRILESGAAVYRTDLLGTLRLKEA